MLIDNAAMNSEQDLTIVEALIIIHSTTTIAFRFTELKSKVSL